MPLSRTLLISQEDVTDFTRFSVHLEPEFANTFIYDVQFREVLPLLCNELYTALIDAIATTAFPIEERLEVLLNGNQITFEGIRAWLAWEVYAQWLREGQSQPTQTGLQTLISQYSAQVNDAQKNDVMASAESKAVAYKNNVLSFLHQNIEDYPEWVGCNDCATPNDDASSLSRISFVGGRVPFRGRLK